MATASVTLPLLRQVIKIQIALLYSGSFHAVDMYTQRLNESCQIMSPGGATSLAGQQLFPFLQKVSLDPFPSNYPAVPTTDLIPITLISFVSSNNSINGIIHYGREVLSSFPFALIRFHEVTYIIPSHFRDE